MNQSIFKMRLLAILFCWLMLQLPAQPCLAQTADSLLKESRLYQRGKKNVTFGAVLLGIGTVSTLVGLSMSEKDTTPYSGNGIGIRDIGPSNKEVVYALGAIFGGIGALKILQGSLRIGKARRQLGLSLIPYWKAPGQLEQMPALTWRYTLGGRVAR
jgi:hypothetical protein